VVLCGSAVWREQRDDADGYVLLSLLNRARAGFRANAVGKISFEFH
jgi:hypothetical protein